MAGWLVWWLAGCEMARRWAGRPGKAWILCTLGSSLEAEFDNGCHYPKHSITLNIMITMINHYHHQHHFPRLINKQQSSWSITHQSCSWNKVNTHLNTVSDCIRVQNAYPISSLKSILTISSHIFTILPCCTPLALARLDCLGSVVSATTNLVEHRISLTQRKHWRNLGLGI